MRISLLLIISIIIIKSSSAQPSDIDSLLNLLNTIKEDTSKAIIKNKLSWSYLNAGELEKAVSFAKESIEMAQKANFLKGVANANNNLGSIYWSQGDYDNALICYENAYKIAVKMGDEQKQSAFIGNVGMIYILKGDYIKALDYVHLALKIEEKLKNEKGIAKNLGVISTIYKEQKDYEKSLKYAVKSLESSLKNNDKVNAATMYGNIGSIYSEQKQHQKALEFYEKAITLEQEMGDQYGLAGELSNIGVVYASIASEKIGDERIAYLKKAMDYFNESLDISKAINYKNIEAFTLYSMGSAYLDLGLPKKAKTLLDSSISIHEKIESIYHLGESYRLLSEADSALGDFRSAYSHYKRHKYWSDRIINEDNQQVSFQKHIQYEYDKKAAADSVRIEEQKKIAAITIREEKTKKYALISGLMLVIIFSGFILNRLKISKKQNKIIAIQKQIVEEKNREITDSINYAKRIQEAILPSRNSLIEGLKNGFVLFKPKDVVSGDFYWLESVQFSDLISSSTKETGNNRQGQSSNPLTLFAAADCTGHGVPGAMVSVVCANALSKALLEEQITDPGKLLDRTRELVVERFAKSEEDVKDGMDIALCALEDQGSMFKVHYAGANNPLWIIRPFNSQGNEDPKNFELQEIKPDKQPIGKYADYKPFTTHTVDLYKGDTIYIFTDGYADQFGGSKGKKFKYNKLKELLLSIQDKTMDEQSDILNRKFEEWKGNLEQVDDVCIIGVRI
jgi:tetratricopeptide (TPR) repeat protein/serine phosphatase RsbU (regulator of sigma subunit)